MLPFKYDYGGEPTALNLHKVRSGCRQQFKNITMHFTIERKIYSPAGYLEAARSARTHPKPYEVEYLNHKSFQDYSKLKYYSSIRPGFKTGDPTVNDLCALQYRPDQTIFYKLNFDSDWLPLPKRATRKSQDTGTIEPSLYKKQLPIKRGKYDQIQCLKSLIPADYHLFYDSLPFEAD